jgi:hypothetical protein
MEERISPERCGAVSDTLPNRRSPDTETALGSQTFLTPQPLPEVPIWLVASCNCIFVLRAFQHPNTKQYRTCKSSCRRAKVRRG